MWNLWLPVKCFLNYFSDPEQPQDTGHTPVGHRRDTGRTGTQTWLPVARRGSICETIETLPITYLQDVHRMFIECS